MKNRFKLSVVTLALVGLQPFSHIQAEDIDGIGEMLANGSTDLSFRYRFEQVDQDGVDNKAAASTLKTRLTYTSAVYNQFNVLLEFDDVTAIGDDRYRTPSNGRTEFPIVADPEGTDINQVFVQYKTEDFGSSLGRQRINHSGQRFLGGVGFRQNEQTYDAFRVTVPATDNFTIDYSYINKVNRIFGPDNSTAQPKSWDSNSHALISSYKIDKNHTVSAFAYLYDFDESSVNSTSTYGLEYKGKAGIFSLAASYATQSDYADNTVSYDADYVFAEVGLSLKPVNLSVGYELLGSDDGIAAFRTPLATLHKFQGWTDKFLATPATGVEDMYYKISGKVGAAKMMVVYHDFESDTGGIDLGSEVDAVITYPVNKYLTTQLKYASYEADTHSVDTDKIWFTINLKL